MVHNQGSARVLIAAAWITGLVAAAQHLAERSLEPRALPLAESLSPYLGPVTKPDENTTLAGKAMCGYQGWFMARGDRYGQGFVHWGAVDRDPPRYGRNRPVGTTSSAKPRPPRCSSSPPAPSISTPHPNSCHVLSDMCGST